MHSVFTNAQNAPVELWRRIQTNFISKHQFLCSLFNPLSPDSDQDQVSPNNIYMLPREMVMRVNKMIT